MGDNGIKIPIEITQQGQGATQAAAEIKKVEQAVVAANTAATASVPAQAAAAQAADKTAVAAGGLSVGLGKAWGGFRMLMNIIPGLGMAGAIGLLVLAFEKLIGLFKDAQESVESMVKKLDGMREVFQKGASERVKFQGSLESIKTAGENAADALARMNDEVDRSKSQEDQLAGKEKALELAVARRDIKDPVKLREKEFEIEQRFAVESANRAKKAIDDKVRNEDEAQRISMAKRDEALLKQKALDEQLTGLRRAQKAAEGKPKTLDEEARRLEKEAEKAAAIAQMQQSGPYASETQRQNEEAADNARKAADIARKAADFERARFDKRALQIQDLERLRGDQESVVATETGFIKKSTANEPVMRARAARDKQVIDASLGLDRRTDRVNVDIANAEERRKGDERFNQALNKAAEEATKGGTGKAQTEAVVMLAEALRLQAARQEAQAAKALAVAQQALERARYGRE
jgi:hypothetical protein